MIPVLGMLARVTAYTTLRIVPVGAKGWAAGGLMSTKAKEFGARVSSAHS